MKFRYLIAAASIAAVAAPALAGPLTITSDMRIEKKVAAADGTTKVVLTKTGKAVPGDHVVITLTYRNTGTAPISNLVLANPVPKGVQYRAPAQGSPLPDVSVDGSTFGTLDSLHVKTAAGGLRAASVNDVTSVRWRLANPVAAGSQGQLSFSAVLQ